ncbi:PAS domain-containing sensor histidine kinase [Aquisalimonas asiatica]|uniref:histidine kinase n=1 Tax=Aquisalimonas asiatica TaxID=406100 RepID=A0A1H8S295_9GAMM|nr:PAS domain-containing sensor histidine kinase [Aquisalimonas asiatica]SEO72554.1 Signal transduction histidine kinase [Aquisalimonas asiatica]
MGTDGRLDNVPCGIAHLDAGDVVLGANATLARMLGCDGPDRLMGQRLTAFMDAPSRIFHQTHMRPLLKLQGSVSEVYLRLLSTTGEPVPVILNARRRAGEEDVVDYAILAAPMRSDYESELVQARREAEEAARAKERFLSTMSHEFRTPLNAIIGFSDLLRAGHAGEINAEQKAQLGYIHEAGRYLNTLVNDILGYTRMGTTELAINLTRLPVATALERVEALVGQEFDRCGVNYRREDGPAGVCVTADPDRIQQILINVLANAAKFTPPGGVVTVRWEERGRQVLIHVADTGPGIPAADRGRIFQPFTQLDNDDNAVRRRGVGLGLAISRELAQAMEGDLTVVSEEGDGSTFTLSLPLAAGQSPS